MGWECVFPPERSAAKEAFILPFAEVFVLILCFQEKRR